MTDDRPRDNHDDDEHRLMLDAARVRNVGTVLTTDQGMPVDDTDNSLRAGPRGPTLIEDYHLRQKIMRFDHERIPERVNHARGAGAHGYFQAYESFERYTSARFLCDPELRTPVFTRFSTEAGSRGSADTVRDVRGFATKFYTPEGNFDLVGSNMPVFFIQDAIKFPDLMHAVKAEPHNEIPQATSAHDTFWDFVSLQPETMHQVIWLMSDRALPRSYRTMQGFGVHTFRLINAAGETTFAKFHWSPMSGLRSLVWEEAQRISGLDPDFHRRDLWESIESGVRPEWELGLQLIPAEHEFDFDIDLLDPTKLIPEEQVPVTPVGRLVLNRNPDNYFAETEQVAFSVGNVVPGIGFSDDPLLQGRLFAYADTQLTRLGGPNFEQLPINRPIASVHHHHQDGAHQQLIPTGPANYHPNTLGGGFPAVAPPSPRPVHPVITDAVKERKRSATFGEHYAQATMFWNSMTGWEKEHIVAAYRFELGNVTHPQIRERVVHLLNRIDSTLAFAVADGLGIDPPQPVSDNTGKASPALSQARPPAPRSALARASAGGVAGAKVAVLSAPEVVRSSLDALCDTLANERVTVDILAPTAGWIPAMDDDSVSVTRALAGTSSVLYDAVVVADGTDSVSALLNEGSAVHFIAEAYRHGKPIGALGSGLNLIRRARLPALEGFGDGTAPRITRAGVIAATDAEAAVYVSTELLAALAADRCFGRPLGATIA
jgi:catalase